MWPRRLAASLIQKRKYHRPPDLLDDLSRRGFIQDITHREVLQNVLQSDKQTVYAGVDPSAKSLHIGHLVPFMCLLHFQLHGHTIIPLIGGATGRVGDPSGRLVERQLADTSQVDSNVVNLTSSIQTFFRRALLYASSRFRFPCNNSTLTEPSVLNNLEWHKSFTLLDFLQRVGVNARVNSMMNRESVRARLSSQQGISFTEFTYQLLQAYDFHHLYKHHGCSIQIGGSDQWGNIVAGLELISRLEPPSSHDQSAPEAYGITTPLLTTSSGEKFGKSAGNAIWLEPSLTSIFDFYQYFLKVTDADVEIYLKLFTLMSLNDIEKVLAAHVTAPEKRRAQHRLAAEVTELVHTKTGALKAATVSKLLFGSEYADLKFEDIVASFSDDPRLVKLPKAEMLDTPITKLASKHGLVSSTCENTFVSIRVKLSLILFKAASRVLVVAKGLYLNNIPILNLHSRIAVDDLLDHRIAILRAGKDKILVLASTD
ncbi:hypothetical protein BYT27DRAFT_7253498 [Phlegmacium glaucopus]|nr:hypothetical protein BYT27DRAFT_7253498 [Phlegmacium glaucopus]